MGADGQFFMGKSNPNAAVPDDSTPNRNMINTLEGVDIEVNDKPKERRLICNMYVKEGVTFGNVMMLLTVKAGIYITATFWNVALVDTLEDPRYYGLDDDVIGR